jgi:acetylornithine aminotransferase
MSSQESLATWNTHLMATYGTPALVLTKGENATVWDETGTRYIDFLSGIAVNSLGHAHPAIVQAVTTQVSTLGHTSNFAAHPQVLQLAQTLIGLTEESARVFFCNSGAEANEAAIKISRLTGRTKIISLTGAFHGRTTGALSLTGQPAKYAPFLPLLPDVTFIEPNDIPALEAAMDSQTAAIWLEPILGEGGVIPLTQEYLQAARALCDQTGALLVIDEVQTGIARTGSMFAYQHLGITPDILLLAKGLGGGLPIGAVIGFGKCANALTPGTHGTTFGGNPISCAAANAVLTVVENEDLASRALWLEGQIRSALEPVSGVTHIRGRGAMLGVVLEHDHGAAIVKVARSSGLITNSPLANVIRLLPPLTITAQELTEGLAILVKAINQVSGESR